MSKKELTRHQLSSRLSYDKQTPSFLRRLQNRVAGIPDDDDNDDEYEQDDRPPPPKRPPIPERPEGDRGSADEEEGDEKPQVVVLKEGKHLTEREAENEKRKQKGLRTLEDLAQLPLNDGDSKSQRQRVKPENKSLSFLSSKKSGTVKTSTGKRKAVGDLGGDASDTGRDIRSKPATKKTRKASKTLLSFGDDA